jgi:hypothetical protein
MADAFCLCCTLSYFFSLLTMRPEDMTADGTYMTASAYGAMFLERPLLHQRFAFFFLASHAWPMLDGRAEVSAWLTRFGHLQHMRTRDRIDGPHLDWLLLQP